MAKLKRNIGFVGISALLVTSLLGTGIFFAPAVAATYSGTASIISWIIMFMVSIYIAFCFAELVSKFPQAGGVYEYSKKAYGRFPSFIIGWTTWLVNTINTPLLIVAALYIAFPNLSLLYFILISVGIIIIMNYIAYRGMKDSSILLIIFAILTLIVIGAFLFKAIPAFNSNFVLPIKTTNYFMILVGIFFISETFFGWESAAFLAEETKNAKKVIPKALIITTLVVGGLSALVAIFSLGIIPISELTTNPNAFNIILSTLFSPALMKYFIIGILVIFIGGAAGNIIATPRLLLAMARDKLFIEQFADIDKKTGTPYKAIIFQTIVSILLIFIAMGQYKVLLSLLIPLSLLMYLVVIITIPILRKKFPDEDSFKAPMGKFLPYVIGGLFLIFIITWLMYADNALYIFRYGLGFIIFGLPVYLLLNVYNNPNFAIRVNEFFSHINLWFENILFPKSLRKSIIHLFSNYRGKTVLEFGSGIGTLTMFIADEIGSSGKLYAIDFSERNIKILNKRILKKGHFHVNIIHDEHLMSRVHPDIKNVDMVFSVGMLGYIQDLERILKQMNDILPDGGKICFVEYMDYFHFLPNPKYLMHKKDLQEMFRKAGFSVQIKKIKGIFWNYSLIYGIKTEHSDSPFI